MVSLLTEDATDKGFGRGMIGRGMKTLMVFETRWMASTCLFSTRDYDFHTPNRAPDLIEVAGHLKSFCSVMK
jgi:hypothetical protein